MDLIKSSRWRNLKNKIKDRGIKPDDALSIMAAVENMHDNNQKYRDDISKAFVTIGKDMSAVNQEAALCMLILKGLIQDDQIENILKDNLSEKEFEIVYLKMREKN